MKSSSKLVCSDWYCVIRFINPSCNIRHTFHRCSFAYVLNTISASLESVSSEHVLSVYIEPKH